MGTKLSRLRAMAYSRMFLRQNRGELPYLHWCGFGPNLMSVALRLAVFRLLRSR